MDRALGMLRNGDWLTRERVRLIGIALLFASAAGFLFLLVTAHGVIDRQGRPLGTDFSNVYAAGTYVLDGDATAPFDPPQQFAREQAIRQRHAILRLALSAVLFVCCGGAGLDAIRHRACGVAGGDARALFDAMRDIVVRSPRIMGDHLSSLPSPSPPC